MYKSTLLCLTFCFLSCVVGQHGQHHNRHSHSELDDLLRQKDSLMQKQSMLMEQGNTGMDLIEVKNQLQSLGEQIIKLQSMPQHESQTTSAEMELKQLVMEKDSLMQKQNMLMEQGNSGEDLTEVKNQLQNIGERISKLQLISQQPAQELTPEMELKQLLMEKDTLMQKQNMLMAQGNTGTDLIMVKNQLQSMGERIAKLQSMQHNSPLEQSPEMELKQLLMEKDSLVQKQNMLMEQGNTGPDLIMVKNQLQNIGERIIKLQSMQQNIPLEKSPEMELKQLLMEKDSLMQKQNMLMEQGNTGMDLIKVKDQLQNLGERIIKLQSKQNRDPMAKRDLGKEKKLMMERQAMLEKSRLMERQAMELKQKLMKPRVKPDVASYRCRSPASTPQPALSSDGGFVISVDGLPAGNMYEPGKQYKVSIETDRDRLRFFGFWLIATRSSETNEKNKAGKFTLMGDGHSDMGPQDCAHVVKHTFMHPRQSISVMWTAPGANAGATCIDIRATVQEHLSTWYMDEDRLTYRMCPVPSTGGSSRVQRRTAPCCACGKANYKVKFEGLWSKETHPRDFPTITGLLHWSNIVGATHSGNYKIWSYGGYASPGVQEVCEFGITRKVENELKNQGSNIRTVIKTPGIWVDLTQTREARFSVNQTHHYLSLLTMIGPSPDWCVGISAEDMCLEDCSWSGDREFLLYPWDAGTDSGISYMSANEISTPTEKIHELNSTYPNDPRSPFFGIPDQPFAKLTVTLLQATEKGEVCEPADDDFFNSPEEDESRCATSEWSEWSHCSVSCGIGYRVRLRNFIESGVTQSSCPSTSIRENENCVLQEDDCNVHPACVVRSWSDWSPCSVSCGKGTINRLRHFANTTAAAAYGQCDISRLENRECVAKIDDCKLAEELKNYEKICRLPRDAGPCTGRSRIRWYYNSHVRRCFTFKYMCRGNQNNFRSQEECQKRCEHTDTETRPSEPPTTLPITRATTTTVRPARYWTPRVGPRVGNTYTSTLPDDTEDEESTERSRPQRKRHLKPEEGGHRRRRHRNCVLTRWQPWSSCSQTCGYSIKTRSRSIKHHAVGNGRPCPKQEDLTQSKRCWKTPPCPQDCEMDMFEPWSECRCKRSSPHGVMVRKRLVLKWPKHGGKPCENRVEKKPCDCQ